MKSIFKILLITWLVGVSSLMASQDLTNMFKVKKPIMAALFLKLPTTASGHDSSYTNYDEEVQKIIDYGLSQQKILKEHDVDAILWEFSYGGITDPQISIADRKTMVTIMKALVAQAAPLKVGFEILWHYPHDTLMVASEAGADFVRLDFFSDLMIADHQEVKINPSEIIELKNELESLNQHKFVLLTDLQVKYAEMKDPTITMDQSALRALSLGSQGVIVSGKESGKGPSQERVCLAKKGAKESDVVIGSGFSLENAQELLSCADAVIVGTSISLKTGGPLVPEKVAALMSRVKSLRP